MPQTHNPTLDLACELIARPSVTPEDAGCLELITGRLQALGFACERIDTGGVSNLWAPSWPDRTCALFCRPH
jgi:succinyl-diaminopimelate desuccinylase